MRAASAKTMVWDAAITAQFSAAETGEGTRRSRPGITLAYETNRSRNAPGER
jgi:hypothetical protein